MPDWVHRNVVNILAFSSFHLSFPFFWIRKPDPWEVKWFASNQIAVPSATAFLRAPSEGPVVSHSEHSSSPLLIPACQLLQLPRSATFNSLFSFTFQRSQSLSLEMLSLNYFLHLCPFLHFHYLNLVCQLFSMRFLKILAKKFVRFLFLLSWL